MSQLINANIAAISANSNGDNTIIAAVTARPIIVWQIAFTAGAAVNFIFKDGASTSLSGAYVLSAAGSSAFFDYTGMPWARTSPGNAFIINLSGAQTIAGQVFYTLG